MDDICVQQATTFYRDDDMLNVASLLPVGSIAFVVESETLYVRVQSGFRSATVSQSPLSVLCSLLAEFIDVACLLFIGGVHVDCGCG